MGGPLDSVRSLWRAATSADRLVALGLIAASFALAAGLRVSAPAAARAVVTVDGTDVASLPLAHDVRIAFGGRRGPVVVVVQDGAARIAESDCPQHLCIAMGAKRRTGEMAACVPNGVVVRIEGDGEDPTVPDAVTR